MLTALPLASPGDTVEVVDDLMRTVLEWQPVTIRTQQWSLLYGPPSEPVELYELRAPIQSKRPTWRQNKNLELRF